MDSGTNGPHVHIEFCQYAGHMSTYVDYRESPAVASVEEQTDICQRFSVSFNLGSSVVQLWKTKVLFSLLCVWGFLGCFFLYVCYNAGAK